MTERVWKSETRADTGRGNFFQLKLFGREKQNSITLLWPSVCFKLIKRFNIKYSSLCVTKSLLRHSDNTAWNYTMFAKNITVLWHHSTDKWQAFTLNLKPRHMCQTQTVYCLPCEKTLPSGSRWKQSGSMMNFHPQQEEISLTNYCRTLLMAEPGLLQQEISCIQSLKWRQEVNTAGWYLGNEQKLML